MWARISVAVLAASLALSSALEAQRPWVGLGVGGGVVLGSPLVEHDLVIHVDDQERLLSQQVDLDDTSILSAHADVFLTRRVSLRAHVSRGDGTLRIATRGAGDLSAAGDGTPADRVGRVRIHAMDAGVSFWPWPPGTVGLAPFVTLGVGRFSYDFDASSDSDYLHISGTRSEPAFLMGIGADLHVWRSVMLRFEAVNHRVDSPLQPTDFSAVSESGSVGRFSDSVSNVRLNLGLQIYLPFRTTYDGGDS